MNKKIFTLLAGACMILSSAFMVNAQRSLPYSHKGLKDTTNFYDVLTADTVKKLPAMSNETGYHYVLSVTGIANAEGPLAERLRDSLNDKKYSSIARSYVLYLDSVSGIDKKARLRLETIAKLDTAYDFQYNNSSYKFGAIRRATWCLTYEADINASTANVEFLFKHYDTGRSLASPKLSTLKDAKHSKAEAGTSTYAGSRIFTDTMDMSSDLFATPYYRWHFTHAFHPDQPIETGKPLYTYMNEDNLVAVLVLDSMDTNLGDSSKYVSVLAGSDSLSQQGKNSDPNKIFIGGYPVTIKLVNQSDLIADAQGNIRLSSSDGYKPVRNVLLFTLKKLNPFVMNAEDWNAVDVSFSPDADTKVSWGGKGADGYVNPFTNKGMSSNKTRLLAKEACDSLYHYGYMQFRLWDENATKKNYHGMYLYVDTAFANVGNSKKLAFNWGYRRSNTDLADVINSTAGLARIDTVMKWGFSFIPGNNKVAKGVMPDPEKYSGYYNAGTQDWGLASLDTIALFKSDSVAFIYAYMKDSIMENQSKFRVTFDPFINHARVNVYQSRVQHEYKVGENFVKPNWTDNSFWVGDLNRNTIPGTLPVVGLKNVFIRPSDLVTGVLYGGYVLPGLTQRTIEEAAMHYYKNVLYRNPNQSGNPDKFSNVHYRGNIGVGGNINFEGHGLDTAWRNLTHWPYNFHSAMFWEETSSPTKMDRVMISTADTVQLHVKYYLDKQYDALAHTYGWSKTSPRGLATYKDSLFYVDLQGLDNSTPSTDGKNTIVTLNQTTNDKELNSRIILSYGIVCTPPKEEVPVPCNTTFLEDDLYLIRNFRGEYLCVPIWSPTDSAYWVTPKEYEDLTQMPSYQWVVENTHEFGDATNAKLNIRRPFYLTNREFPGVRYKMELPITAAGGLTFFNDAELGACNGNIYAGKQHGATFNKLEIYPKRTSVSIGLNEIDPANFVSTMKGKAAWDTGSFIPLKSDVKNKFLLGYEYVNPDSTIVDVYAFKYLHGLAMGDKARYISWNGYEDYSDTVVFVKGQDEFDKLYFDLMEMDENALPKKGTGYDAGGLRIYKNSNLSNGYKGLYDVLKADPNSSTSDSVYVEKYGYYTHKTSGNLKDLVPLVRQAYRLFLKDNYKWHPTMQGDFMTVGSSDKYILADRAHATKEYVFNPNKVRVEGLFGIPYFYFRNTYFDISGHNSKDDYFALLQRLDTARVVRENNVNNYNYETGGKYSDVVEYLTLRFDREVATRIMHQLQKGHQYAAFVALVEDKDAALTFNVRSEATHRISTFQLEKDDDPIYRRFHVNEPDGSFKRNLPAKTPIDRPDTLVFHKMNQGDDAGYRLYENSGDYKLEDGDKYGPSGGRYYNVVNGEYMQDTLNHVISFLGINEKAQFGKYTNYSFYVDTAYVNRGTGWIKPQYMMVVDPLFIDEDSMCVDGKLVKNRPYVLGRYMYNTAMYSKALKNGGAPNFSNVEQIDQTKLRAENGKSYVYNQMYERFAFAWAIHMGDTLYVLKGLELEPLYGDNAAADVKKVYQKLLDEYGVGGSTDPDAENVGINFKALIAASRTGFYNQNYSTFEGHKDPRRFHHYNKAGNYGENAKGEARTIGLHAEIALDDNAHKDWVFSFRYIERKASDFVIESETAERNNEKGATIAPGYGGWLQFNNEVPIITRTDRNEIMSHAYQAVFNVKKSADEYADEPEKQAPVDNEDFAKFTVIGGTGSVTILNAANKNVVITNVLGQTIVNKTITSENATIEVPAGVVVVAAQGEAAVKVLVK